MSGWMLETHLDGLEFEPANLAAGRTRTILRIRHLGDNVPFRLAEGKDARATGRPVRGPSPQNADNVYYVR